LLAIKPKAGVYSLAGAAFAAPLNPQEQHPMERELPKGVLAYREYAVELPDGTRAGIALTLDDIHDANSIARNLQRRGAREYGTVYLADIPGAPKHSLLWMLVDHVVALTAHDEDELTDDVKRLVARHLTDFFAELVPTMPWLAEELASQGLMDDPG
jgi:hypothetical protein